MELIYLYIENYKDIIKDTEIHLTSSYAIKVTKEKNEHNVQIDEVKKPVNIFSANEEGVSDIYAIIGKNGVGKSTLLKAIGELNFSGIFILKTDNKVPNTQKFIVKHSNKLSIVGNGFQSQTYTFETNLSTFIPNMHKIYYDNIFNPFVSEKIVTFGNDWEKEPISIQKDISTNYTFFSNSERDKLKYVSNETKNALILFSKIKNNELLIDFEIITPKFLYIENIMKNLLVYDFSEEDTNNFIYNLTKNIMFILLFETILKSKNSFVLNEDELETLDILTSNIVSNKDTAENIYNKLNNDIHELPDVKVIYKSNKDMLVRGIEIIKNFEKMINQIKNDIKIKKNKMEINIANNEVVKELKDFLIFVKENSIGEHFFEYSYDRDYSSGERGLITLFSRLVSVSKDINDNTRVQNLIILLDEPEIFAHPEWQRTFINNIIIGLNRIFPNKKIKVILTSHSPFIASDLPKENVIMLEKSEDGKCIVKDNKINTFGANIFDLYSKAFFVESSFGEFAKEKIRDIVSLYENNRDTDGSITYPKEKEIEDRKDETKYIISSIGEHLVKRKLQDIYNEYETNKLNNGENKKLLEEFEKLSMEEKLQLIKLKKENNGEKNDKN